MDYSRQYREAVVKDLIPRLEIRNLVRRYDRQAVVDHISLVVNAGQVTCLLGPSGCGKSTTLRMIAGVEMQDEGEIHVDGRTICSKDLRVPPEQRQIGLMFQDFSLFPHLDVEGNVGFGLRKRKKYRLPRVNELLERVGLAGFGKKYPHELSGGEQQRVALARALAPEPRIMLMDEPFSGLDNRLRDGIRDETLEILREQDTAVLLVTHEPEEAMRMADNIALMRSGRIIQQGAPYNIFNAPVDRDAVAFFSDVNVVRAKVRGSLAETPFGQFLAPGVPDGRDVEIVVRPQHIKIDFDRHGKGPAPTISYGTAVQGIVKRSRFIGSESLVELRMGYDDSVFKVTLPGVFLPKPGTPLWLMIRRDKCFLFPLEHKPVT
ncbi:MAG: ABC transporter ATP-binding protein [Roseovarius sp.]|nr:ABC transporter ATP-binding protein [Roseovarius sp.]